MRPILTNKLMNAINKETKTPLYFDLSNISINGIHKGCSGFIKNKENGLVVYVNTELCSQIPDKYLYRYAENTEDFVGYRNRWASSLVELAIEVCKLLVSPQEKKRDYRL